MNCTNCGMVVEEGRSYCPNCGAPVQKPYAERYSEGGAVPGVSATPVLVWGIIGLSFACTFYLSFLGIIFSAVALNKFKAFYAATGYNAGKAKVGRILAKVGLILGIVLTSILVIVIFAGIGAIASSL